MSRYLVLEGGDGCGKSSQAEALVAAFRARGEEVLHLREPGSTPVGEALRALLLSPDTGTLRPITEALLFFAARGELVDRVIRPALREGKVIVAERCYLSTIVYQGLASDGGVDPVWVRDLTARVHGDVMPDRILVLDVPVEVARARRSNRTADRFEERGGDYLERVRRGFREAAAGDPRAIVIDADRPFDVVASEILARAGGV